MTRTGKPVPPDGDRRETRFPFSVPSPLIAGPISEHTRALRLPAATPGAGHRREDLADAPVKFWQAFCSLIGDKPANEPLGVARVLHASQDLAALPRMRAPRVNYTVERSRRRYAAASA